MSRSSEQHSGTKVLTLAASAFSEAAIRLRKSEDADAFRECGAVLADFAEQIRTADESAHSRFPADLSHGCAWMADGLAILARDADPNPELRALRAFTPAADGMALLASALRTGAASLEKLEQRKGHAHTSAEVTAQAVISEMNQLAAELSFMAAAYHRVFQADIANTTRDGPSQKFLNRQVELLSSVYKEGASPLMVFSQLLVVNAALFQRQMAAVFTSIAALLPILVIAYIPWHCHQECIGDGRLLQASLSRTTSRTTNQVDPLWSQGGTLGILTGFLVGHVVAIQPQIYINWSFCCYNMCVLFWNNQWVETVETGPHDIGPPISNNEDANARATERATPAALLTFPRPPAP